MLTQPGLRAVNLSKNKLIDRLANKNPELATQIRNTKLEWYTMRNQASDDVGPAEIYVYDEIGGSFGVGAMDFIEELNQIDSEEIVVRINSPGGLLVDAIAISSALAQHPAKIITRVDGIAASAASLIAVAGDKCEMMIGSQMMIHDVICQGMGNAKDFREIVDWLEEQSRNVAEIYAKRAPQMDADEWRNLMLAETWMFAQEAVDAGLADNVYERAKIALPGQEDPEEDPEKEDPEEEPEEDTEAVAEEDDDEEEVTEEEALDALMHRSHRLTNRGYKYLGRNRAPRPGINSDNFTDLLAAWR